MNDDLNQQVPSLDPSSFATLLDEVSAMTAARRSLMLGLTDFSDMSLGKLGRAAKFVCTRLNQGSTPADSIAPLSTQYGSTVRTAFEVVSQTGSTEAIDHIVSMIRDEEQAKRDRRIALVHPLINVLVAGAVLVWVIPQILTVDAAGQRMKDGLEHSITQVFESHLSDYWSWLVVSAIGLALFSGLMSWVILRLQRRIVSLTHQANFCRWMALMVGSNSDLASSIEAASSAVSSRYAQSWTDSASQVRGGAHSLESLKIPGDVPAKVGQCIADLASNQRSGTAVAQDLYGLSELYHQQSIFRSRFGLEVIPRIVSLAVVAIAILIIVKTAIKPLIEVSEQVAR